MTQLYPVLKVNEQSMLSLWQGLPLKCIVVRLQDLISPKTLKPNKTFFRIKKKGGIHNFLGFHKNIILSLIIKDELIAKCDVKKYAEIINALKPDFYITIDGTTYEDDEEKVAEKEIERCFLETKELIKLCVDSKPLGLVKGRTKKQILNHVFLLKGLGINDFVFHIGDFFRNNSTTMLDRAKTYSLLIRKYSDSLILYGMGSQKKLFEFSFADAYVTFNHFVKARNGMRYSGTNVLEFTGGYKYEIVRKNLVEMLKNIDKMKPQKKLIEGGVCLWEAELEEQELVMSHIKVPVRAV